MSELVTFHGASGELAEKLIAAHKAALRVREITHGSNAYPEPFNGEFFVTGFDNFAAAQEFAKANGGVVGDARWKNGWNCVEAFRPAFKPLTITGDLANLLGDNDSISTAGAERDFLNDELIAARENEDEDRVAELNRKLAALADYRDATILHMNCGDIYESYTSDEAMSVSYDTINYEIGVCLTATDDESEEEDVDA